MGVVSAVVRRTETCPLSPENLTLHRKSSALIFIAQNAADLDRDGDLDLTNADYTPHNMLYLFENDSRGNFKRHVV